MYGMLTVCIDRASPISFGFALLVNDKKLCTLMDPNGMCTRLAQSIVEVSTLYYLDSRQKRETKSCCIVIVMRLA